MSAADISAAGAASAKPAIGFFERYLTVWVALCIVIGVVLGQLLPGLVRPRRRLRSRNPRARARVSSQVVFRVSVDDRRSRPAQILP